MKGLSNWGSPRTPANMVFGLAGVVIFFVTYSKLHYQSNMKHFLVAAIPAGGFYLLVNLLFIRRRR